MQPVNTVIKFVWVVSVLTFLGVLLFGYYLLPGVVCIRFSASGAPLEYWDKKNLFYSYVGAFALLNILILLAEKLLLLLPAAYKPIPNRTFWLTSNENKEKLQFVLSSWFYSLLISINLAVLASYGVLWKVNYDIQSSIIQFAWVANLIIGLLVVCILYLPIRLFISK